MGVRGQYKHLASAQATDEDVLDYLLERSEYIKAQGGTATPLDVYWQEGDLDRYRAAQAAWATDVPNTMALPDLPTLLNGVAGPAGMPHTTFIADLTAIWNRYAAWMQNEGRDLEHPNETPRERSLRKARDSVARSRERRTTEDPARLAVLNARKDAYDEYLAACRERQRVVSEQNFLVAEALRRFEVAKLASKNTS